ncbi:hypothetical protein V6N13_088329 [Hibiscus sabdariffa]|uniref:Phorbol-ester/DAG-type domain-containing protein n=1 Tax=Hibiscus sabdariffa TaxID=183260 RepID=A0ABR2FZW2_9ROSI
MEFQHFLHPHKLRSMEFEDKHMVICFGCLDFIVGPAYYCTECRKFVMHKSCGAFPTQVQKDTFHPHPLICNTWDVFVCDACGRLTASFINYRCMHCEFKLHLKCAMAIFNDENEIGKRGEENHQKITIRHFCHPHQLTRCTLSLTTHMEKELWRALKSKCVACNLDIQETPLLIYLYVCFYCLFIIHESCMNEMPRQVQRSPFHPLHVLLPRPFLQDTDASRQVQCYACRETIEGCSFYCNKCDVNLHVSCAKYQTRAIKHTCHPHNLLQLGKSIIHNISCDACGEDCNDSCFSCKKCDFYIHPQCIPLPSSFIHKHHLHPLALVSPFVEDDSGDYYCDMCETKRNPDLQVYYCEECNFIAHIDCVLYEVLESTIEMHIDPKENSGDENWELEERGHNKMSPFHPHPLRTVGFQMNEDDCCFACKEKFEGLIYSCLSCGFHMHYSCATYKFREVKHDFHADHHLLHLGKGYFGDGSPLCKTCGQTCKNTAFYCLECMFYIHLECIPLPAVVKHKRHLHPLVFTTVTEDDSEDYYCDTCETKRNPEHDVYHCSKCNYISHIDCVISEASTSVL